MLVRPNLLEFRWKIRKFVETSVHVGGRRGWTPGSNHPRAEISQARRGGRFGEPPLQIVAAFHVNSAIPDKGSRTINYSNINLLWPFPTPTSSFSRSFRSICSARGWCYIRRRKICDIKWGLSAKKLSRRKNETRCTSSYKKIAILTFFQFSWKQMNILWHIRMIIVVSLKLCCILISTKTY